MIGKVVSHYKILEKLGEGGMGVVYKAQDTKLDRFVALKFLPPRAASSVGDKARFLQEAKAAAALNHNNICTIYGVDESEWTMFIAMEFIEGGTLREKIPFASVADAISVAMQIGEALQEAHSKGIVHRDIKADNVMLTSRGQVKVMDFGLAKLKGSLKLTRTSSTVGTLGYMAPEQIQGGAVDNRSDIFSFGILLFEMLTGRLPFRGEHEAAVVYSIVNGEPESLQKYRTDVSPELVRLFEKALEKDPADRYQTAAEMVVDLRHVKKQSTKVSREFARPSAVTQASSPSHASLPAEQSPPQFRLASTSFLSKYKWWLAAGASVCMMVASVLFYFRGHPAELNPGMTTRVLEIPVTEIDYPGLSGDGNWTAFPARDAGGLWHVYLMNTGGGEPREITTDSMSFMGEADISMDGSRVVYTGALPGTSTPDIFVTSALGGGSRMIARGGTGPRWQPDGKRVFFLRGLGISASASRRLEIWSVAPEGTDERLEFIDSISVDGRISLSVSPDGRAVVWLRTFPEGNYQEVVVHELVSGAERQLTFDRKNCDEVCWASNNQILFSSNRTGNTNLWMVPAEGGPRVQITKGVGPDLGMRISIDLKKLLYYESQDIGDVWIGSLASGTARQLTFDDRNKSVPRLSPDGKLILYGMSSADPLNPQNSIYLSNRDGSNQRQLVSSPGFFLFGSVWPHWSPDGSRIAYSTSNPLVPTDASGAVKTYVIEAVRAGVPKFVADGLQFVWLNADSLMLVNGGKTWLASVATGQVHQFFEDSTIAFPVLGGKFVAYEDLRKSTEGYWVVEVDGGFKRKGAARRLDERKDGFTRWATSPSRDFAIFGKTKGRLLKVWLASGKEESIPGTFLNADNATSHSVNPGTNEFVYDVHRAKGRLVIIENVFK